MYVGTVMRKEIRTVAPETTLVAAQEILEQEKINHLLIVDRSNELMGIVSDRDLKKSWASSATTLSKNELIYLLDQVTVAAIMTRKTLTISPATTIERAALLMNQHNINALPVLEDDELVGIITSRDVMGVLLEAVGIEKDSSRLTVLVKDRIGVIADISRSLRAEDIIIRSLFTWPAKTPRGVYYLVVRVPAGDGDKAEACLAKEGFKVLTAYTQDLDPYQPAS